MQFYFWANCTFTVSKPAPSILFSSFFPICLVLSFEKMILFFLFFFEIWYSQKRLGLVCNFVSILGSFQFQLWWFSNWEQNVLQFLTKAWRWFLWVIKAASSDNFFAKFFVSEMLNFFFNFFRTQFLSQAKNKLLKMSQIKYERNGKLKNRYVEQISYAWFSGLVSRLLCLLN